MQIGKIGNQIIPFSKIKKAYNNEKNLDWSTNVGIPTIVNQTKKILCRYYLLYYYILL